MYAHAFIFDTKINEQFIAISSYLNLSNSDSDKKDIYDFYFLPLEEKAAHIKKHLDSVYRRADKIFKILKEVFYEFRWISKDWSI